MLFNDDSPSNLKKITTGRQHQARRGGKHGFQLGREDAGGWIGLNENVATTPKGEENKQF